MHHDLDYVDAIGVGLFLQTLLLGLTARGLGTCVQVSIAGYPEKIRAQLGRVRRELNGQRDARHGRHRRVASVS